MLTDEEIKDLFDSCWDDDFPSMCRAVEEAVLAKALAQQERLHKEWSELWSPIDEAVRPLTPIGESVAAKALELINTAKAMQKQEPDYWKIGGLGGDVITNKKSELDLAERFNWPVEPLYKAPQPAQAAAMPEWLMEMSEQMRTQDNRGTSHPFFQVRCKRYIVTEQGYNEFGYELCTDDGVIYRSYAAEEDDLEKLLTEDYPEFCEQLRIDQGDETIEDAISCFDPTEDDLPEGVRLVYVQETEEIVSTHLTEFGARQFIKRKQHDYPKLYTYAESAYWSPQLRQLQEWIISLSASPKPE